MTIRRLVLALVLLAGATATMATAATRALPGATTGSASSVTGTTATLNGSVNPNGAATTWQFELGTSTGYGSRAPSAPQSAGAGSASSAVKTAVSGLQPGTTYHYRLTATNAGGTTVGADATFKTQPAPGVGTRGSSSVGTTSATVACDVDPNGLATTWSVEYGTTSGYGTMTSAQSAGSGTTARRVTAALTGLRGGTTYHYRCVASSSAGTSRGGDASFATRGAPSAATGAASAIGPTSATVAGTVNPNGTATNWWIEYGTTTAYGARTAAQSAGSGTGARGVGATLVGLAPGTLYHYRFAASSSLGTTRGVDATFTTVGPPAVTTGTVPFAAIAPGSAKVTGSVNPHGLAATAWFEYGRTPSYGQRTPDVAVAAGTADVAVEATLSGLVPGVRYYFRLASTSTAGTAAGAGKSFATPSSSTAAGKSCTISGTQGNDILRGTPGRDVICGLAGNDVIHGLGGNDVVLGGPGNDVISGGPGNDVLQGGLGTDQLLGGTGNDQISGGAGNDSISARDGRRDVVVGGPGRDTATLDKKLDRTVSLERRRY
jgi:Ca2+-binding RTX toxin-like protein